MLKGFPTHLSLRGSFFTSGRKSIPLEAAYGGGATSRESGFGRPLINV